MLRSWACLMIVVAGCATESVDVEPPNCCARTTSVHGAEPDTFVDVMPRLDGPERCEATARARLSAAPDDAWRELWRCVASGRFTALRPLLTDAWDHELRTRRDAPTLLARVIASRGGNVEGDLHLLHARRLSLFTLSQALARPDMYRGALVILRGRVSAHGIVDETRIVSQPWDVPVSPTQRVVTQASVPFASDIQRLYTSRRDFNLDIETGVRVMASIDGDPFIDADDVIVVVARFEGMRDVDGWPLVTVLDHLRPNATIAY
jgi:hypothetical protein